MADFKVSSPNGGKVWLAGSNQEITWTWVGEVPKVKIEYSIDAGATFAVIAVVDNEGSYTWRVPTVNTSKFRVKVSDLADSSSYDVSDSDSTITNTQ
jgi:hypothetical protein